MLSTDYITGMDDNKKSESGINNKSSAPLTEDQIEIYQRQLRRLATELSLAEARERREIASDLHDHIGQALAYVSQKVSLLHGNDIFSGRSEDFAEILSILDQTIKYTRNLTVEISPPILYELGLPAAIDWLAERAEKRYNLKIKSTQTGQPKEIAENIRVFLFKAIQELLVNISKHAQAPNVKIEINWGLEQFEIKVSDNGVGFDQTKLNLGLSDRCCFGLFSIRERLSYIGGNFAVESIPGKGTRVTLTSPYEISDEVNNA